ncbi:MAG: hypothetical protein HOB40_00005 [Candidatus Marinimicrobia bacterium]|nr:hypothetical protein [Candidatus Neomarinimicrobiota bacterium]MBT3840273.1 hypothetical protein [Candidatus Neomarinimicrobiota bacterium]MBT3998935.1 hypothetical protein [Candidatus Neomarinimicrobiota bacterium]MBT4283191.1 hypothetical protein [Candidatus Neomarinimicrobiota bacterium]MBT4579845.1 hypothetical protein [Candidatus Neomarinimicrobiota bacterium]
MKCQHAFCKPCLVSLEYQKQFYLLKSKTGLLKQVCLLGQFPS